MQAVRNALELARPFVGMVALLFGIIAAWLALAELFPILGQIWRPRGSAQSAAIVAGALALVAGR